MKSLIIAAGLLISAPAFAQMPPATYDGPLGDRLMAGFRCVGTSVKDGGVTLPKSFGVAGALLPGQYRNPTTCAIEGAPSGPQF
jgi:hypothetical protein